MFKKSEAMTKFFIMGKLRRMLERARRFRSRFAVAAFPAAALAMVGCGETGQGPIGDAIEAASGGARRSLYVASGACYGGGVATAPGPANTIVKYDLSTGALKQVVADYNQISPGDAPVSFVEYDANRLLVLVENAGGRRIDLINKDGSGGSAFLINATALSAVMRGMLLLPDSSLLVSKSSAIEKFTGAKARVTSGVNPFVNAPAAPCATSTTLISSIATSPSGKILYTHAAPTPNNILGVIKSTGYAVAADCLASSPAPATTALPTKAIFHSSGKVLVAYGSATLASNFIYSYSFNDATGAISGAAVAFNDGGAYVNGPSTMAEDPASGDVFVANATSTYNTIERFRFAAGALARVPGATFIQPSAYTRCIAHVGVMP